MKELVDKRFCRDCGDELTDSNRVKQQSIFKCRPCYNLYTYERVRKFNNEKKYWGESIPFYSNHDVKPKPGEFLDEEQKQHVTNLLNAIGWIYNQDKNIWYDKKEKIRNSNGEWKVDISSSSADGYDTKWRNYIQNNGIPKIGKYNPRSRTAVDIPKEHLNDDFIRILQEQFFLNNYTRNNLKSKYGAHPSMIRWVVTETVKKIKNNIVYEK